MKYFFIAIHSFLHSISLKSARHQVLFISQLSGFPSVGQSSERKIRPIHSCANQTFCVRVEYISSWSISSYDRLLPSLLPSFCLFLFSSCMCISSWSISSYTDFFPHSCPFFCLFLFIRVQIKLFVCV